MQTAPSASYSMTVRLIPSVFDKRVVEAVADGVARAAAQTGVARRCRRTLAVGSATPNG